MGHTIIAYMGGDYTPYNFILLSELHILVELPYNVTPIFNTPGRINPIFIFAEIFLIVPLVLVRLTLSRTNFLSTTN